MKILIKTGLMLCCISFLFSACKTKPASDAKANYPEWAKNAVIYEVNVRQYTPEGTFKAFEANLPRLKDMRKGMIDAMKYWIDTCNIDGFRCDVAAEVPVDFWEEARAELEKVKPLFMLAEEEGTKGMCNKAFDANYGWGMHHVMHNVAQGKDSVYQIARQVLKVDSIMPKNAFQMNFITNHDENSWNGTATEKFGFGAHTFAVLTYTLPGMPLIYSGQEAGLAKRLKFFVKDTIDWRNGNDHSAFYKTLGDLKHTNQALWNAPYGGTFELIKNNEPGKILSFIREKGNSKVVVIANLSADKVTVNLKESKADDDYTDVFSKTAFTLNSSNLNLTLQPWGYWVIEKK